jgi:hypothetical protein
MQLARLALPLFVIISIGTGLTALIYAPSPPSNVPEQRAGSKPSQTARSDKPEETNSARDVGGSAIQAPVAVGQTMERIAPVKPIKTEFFGPPIPVKPKPELVLMFQPVIENAGTIIVEGRNISLLNVFPIEADLLCTDQNGREWPCGKAARTAFRAMVRGRAIMCRLPDQQKVDVEAECGIGNENLGQWLVEQGWAEARPGSDFESLGEAARLSGRGIFGKGS